MKIRPDSSLVLTNQNQNFLVLTKSGTCKHWCVPHLPCTQGAILSFPNESQLFKVRSQNAFTRFILRNLTHKVPSIPSQMNHSRHKFHQIFSTLCWTFYQIFNPGKDIRTKNLHGGQFWKLIQVPPSLFYSSLGQGPHSQNSPLLSLYTTLIVTMLFKKHMNFVRKSLFHDVARAAAARERSSRSRGAGGEELRRRGSFRN